MGVVNISKESLDSTNKFSIIAGITSLANSIYNICYGNGTFVAVDATATTYNIMTSPDGIFWYARTSPISSTTALTFVSYANGLFIAGGLTSNTSSIITSPDGITWTVRTAYIAVWRAAAYGNGKYVVVAQNGGSDGNVIMTSPDGITWTKQTIPITGVSWTGVCYGNGIFVVVGNKTVMTSPDGITWTVRVPVNLSWYSVCYANGIFVAGSNQEVTNSIMTSPDGITWTERYIPYPSIMSFIATDGKIFMAGYKKGIFISKNGIDWEHCPTISNYVSFIQAYGNGIFIAKPAPSSVTLNSIAYAINLNTYSEKIDVEYNLPTLMNYQDIDALNNKTMYAMAYGNGVMVGIEYSASTTTTVNLSYDDGDTWEIVTFDGVGQYYDIAFGNGVFVTVSGINASATKNKPIAYSTDGINWSLTGDTTMPQFLRIIFANNMFIAIGNTQYFYTSTDGITWTKQNTGYSSGWYDICYGAGLFVAVGSINPNHIITSPDGITWTLRTTPDSSNTGHSTICYGNGLFVLSGANTGLASIMTSPDGITWTSRSTTVTLDHVYYINGMFIGFDNNTYIISSDGINWYASNKQYTPRETFRILYHNGYGYSVNPNSKTTGKFNFNTRELDDYVYRVEPAGLNWISRESAIISNVIPPNGWYGGCYGNGKFVIVASATGYKRVITSIDGIKWDTQDAPAITYGFYDVCYGTKFVAVGVNNVCTSPDGITWTQQSIGDAGWYKVAYGNGKYVAVAGDGAGNRLAYSSDGITWTSVGLGVVYTWYGIYYASAHSCFLASRYNTNTGYREIVTSPDGINWTVRLSSSTDIAYSFTYGNGIYVASGSGYVHTSTDTITWTKRTTSLAYTWYDIEYGNGLFVINGSGAGISSMTSPDGITWTSRVSRSGSNLFIIFGNGVFVTADLNADSVYRSVDGISWTAQGAVITDYGWDAITYGNGTFVAVSGDSSGKVILSTDKGITWNQYTAKVGTWMDICYAAGLFVAVSQTGNTTGVMTSPDGITWTSRTTPTNKWNAVCYGNGLFVAVSYDVNGNKVMTSPDGITWTLRSTPSNNYWYGLCYGNDLFVAVSTTGVGNRVMTSPDGINWSLGITPEDNNWYKVCYGNGLFVAIASTGIHRVMTSPDGIVWTARETPINKSWNSIAFNPDAGIFVLSTYGTSSERVLVSKDAITWEIVDFADTLGKAWQRICFGDGAMVAVASYSSDGKGKIQTSHKSLVQYQLIND